MMVIDYILSLLSVAISGSFNNPTADTLVEQELKALESRPTEDVGMADIRAEGF